MGPLGALELSITLGGGGLGSTLHLAFAQVVIVSWLIPSIDSHSCSKWKWCHSKLDALLLNSSSHFRFISIFQLGISTPSKWHLTPGGRSCCATLHWDGGSGEAYSSAQGGHQGGPPGECLALWFLFLFAPVFLSKWRQMMWMDYRRSSSQYRYVFSGWWYFSRAMPRKIQVVQRKKPVVQEKGGLEDSHNQLHSNKNSKHLSIQTSALMARKPRMM